MKFLNLACGSVYVQNGDWVNMDYFPNNDGVIGFDLLRPLPFESRMFDLVYSSHFLEHIPKPLVPNFLCECNRVLKPGGVIRLVFPNCEEMFTTYLAFRRNGEHQKADFLIIEIIDQCVRSVPGGELAAFYKKIRAMPNCKVREEWAKFIFRRTGNIIDQVDEVNPLAFNPLLRVASLGFSLSLRDRIGMLSQFFRKGLHYVGLKLLDPAFRSQNVTFASIGEKHQWIWDFFQVKDVLEKCGFTCVSTQSHVSSSLASFPFCPLDSSELGVPRQGRQSIYVEAFKVKSVR